MSMIHDQGGVTNFNLIMTNRTRHEKDSGELGGSVKWFRSASASLKVGDIVFVTAAVSGVPTVTKSATAANYAGFVGVVVGGPATQNYAVYGTGAAACDAIGQYVLVQIDGIALVVAEGTITAGTNFSVISTATTAGRVIAGTTQGAMVGIPLQDAVSGDELRILICHR